MNSSELMKVKQLPPALAALARRCGMGVWLAAALAGNVLAQNGGLLREVYTEIGGSLLEDLLASEKFPDRPDLTEVLPEFEAPTDVLDYYGQRLRGFLVPPSTGSYVFWIASDDESVLYLSSTTSPAEKIDIAAVPGWTSSREWDKYPSQQSGVIRLEASKMYYVEALMKEGGGGDNLAVRWQLPGGTLEEPIPETRLIPFGTVLTPPVIRAQPTNLVVIEGQPATFTVVVSNPDPIHYQWRRDGLDISGANAASYTLPSARLTDGGATFRCALTNSLGAVVSSAASLAVNPDLTPPTLRQAHNIGANTVVVTFSEPVDYASARVAENYQLDQGQVLIAQPETDGRVVSLRVEALVFERVYAVTVNNVKDRSRAGHVIAPGSRLSFVASSLAALDLGEFAAPGQATVVPGGFDISAIGTGLGSWADQLHFSYQERTGDFDARVRVAAVELTDVWATGGLMARQLLSTNGPMTGVFATPSISGVFFASRGSTNALATSPSQPVNYPFTWLRLRRAGEVFTGYTGFDGLAWRQLGIVTNPMPARIYVGLSVSSQQTNRASLAQFREFGDVISATEAEQLPDFEALGPSTRRSPLTLSEIMYHPAARADGANLEYVELFNSQPVAEPIGGFRLAGAIDYTFPPDAKIDGGGFVVVAKEPAALRAATGLSSVHGPYANNLPGDQGRVILRNHLGAVLVEVEYSDQPPWPASADGAGHSLVLARPSLGADVAGAWSASQMRGGSPGAMEPLRLGAWSAVKINEFLAHTDAPVVDFVELYNAGTRPVDLSGAGLSDSPVTSKFRIAAGTLLGPGGFLHFTQDDLGFALSSSGETLYLVSPDDTQVIDAVRFGAQANGVSSGRYPDGAPGFHELRRPTPGGRNEGLRIGDLVINEIMFHPPSGDDADEYVELYNRGAQPVDLSHWRFIDGIDFAFPAGQTIPAGGYLVVAKNAARLQTNHAGLKAGVVGDYQGQLANDGERVALARPSDPTRPLADFVVVDEVTYGEGGRWGRWADGGGSSLELVDARGDNRLASNWAVSDETGKSAWVTVEHTGLLDLGTETFGVNRLQVLLMGEGECLVDDVEVIGPSGNQLVPNSSFEQGAQGWRTRGTHTLSSLETTEGYRGRQSFHLRASGRGATDANHVFIDLLGSLTPGTHATLRAKARWLRGNPEILLRLRGNFLEAPGRLPVPRNTGTPGARNSTARDNLGPAIWNVRHSPILPALGQSVLVTARVHDPDGLSAVTCAYRVDPAIGVTLLALTDDGTAGDALAGDGLYSATLPAQSTTNLLAFIIQASDASTGRQTSQYPADAPRRECLVRWGEPAMLGNLGTYRLWMTRATLSEWAEREPSSNDPLPVTFVYGHQRVVYGASAMYSGSPFHWGGYDSPVGLNCNYVLLFPTDDRFLGATDFVLNLPANLGSDRSAQREQFFFAMAREMGRPYAYRRFCHLMVNGLLRPPIFEDAQQPNRDFVEQWFPEDAGGELFKIEDWFDYDDTISSFVNVDATLEDFTTADGDRKLARYRWNWRKRAVRDSAHDYTRLFELVDALNANDQDYTTRVESLVDVEGWMRTFALRHVVGDWDAYGYRRGKNMYAYRPVLGRWQLLDWDVAFAFGLGDGPDHDFFDAAHFDGSIDVVTERMYNHPPFRRAYLRALYDAAYGPLVETWSRPWLESTYTALTDNTLAPTSPGTILTWIRSRRLAILDLLATNDAPFAVTSNGGRDFTVAGSNFLELEGTAPVQVRTLRVNGRAYPVTWTGVTSWRMRLPLRAGANRLALEGLGSTGAPLPNATAQVTVSYSGVDQRPQDHLVISEILYHPAADDTGFVELHNTSTTHAFDLTGFELRGTGFTFAEGTLIEPDGYLVVVSARSAFGAAYGYGAQVAGVFPGRLRNDGETLRLVQPGATPAEDVLIDQVTYDDSWPWPAAADGQGSSLQLVDPAQDNRRPGAWVAVTNDPSTTTTWQFAEVTGIAAGDALYLYLQSSGDVFLDDVWLVAGTVAQTGTNLVLNAGFEQPLGTTWTVSATDPNTRIDSTLSHTGTACLHLVTETGGNFLLPSVGQSKLSVRPGEVYTLSFWYLPSATGGGLTAGLLSSALERTVSLVPGDIPLPLATPGAANVLPRAFEPLPPLWINEVMPNNVNGPHDRSGHADPWLEILNVGSEAVSLANLYLAHNSTNLLEWPFPANASIQPGQRLVIWADGEPGESTAEELHTAFRLDALAGAISLARDENGQARVVDYLSYAHIPADRSYGSLPEGDPDARQVFHFPTPGSANSGATDPVQVYFNEWMAANTAAVVDPADQDFDDWFELHNPNDFAVDLSGYSLTDDLASPRQWVLPVGTSIPRFGFLLVWADNEPDQNDLGLGLHVNFRLNQDGDSLALFAPDGTVVDAVTFGTQSRNVSEGRYPDGAPGPFVAMTVPTPGAPNVVPGPVGPEAIRVELTDQGLVLAWSLEVGRVYQLEYTDDLVETTWQPLGDPTPATQSPLVFIDPLAALSPQRFYRLVLLP